MVSNVKRQEIADSRCRRREDIDEEGLTYLRDQAAGIILGADYVIGIGGAGMSVESGIRPFRGPGGLWTERGELDMSGHQRFLADPKGSWEARLGMRGQPSARGNTPGGLSPIHGNVCKLRCISCHARSGRRSHPSAGGANQGVAA